MTMDDARAVAQESVYLDTMNGVLVWMCQSCLGVGHARETVKHKTTCAVGRLLSGLAEEPEA